MALEAELRSRVERSLKELEEIALALHEVRRLADSQQASAEQLARVSAVIESTGGQFRALLEGVGQSGALLQSAVEAVRAADPVAVLNRVDAVGDAVAHVGRSFEAVSARVDAIVQLGESAQGELSVVRAAMTELPGTLEAGVRAQAAALDRLERAVTAKVGETSGRLEVLEQRVRTVGTAAWAAAGTALIAAVIGLVGLLR